LRVVFGLLLALLLILAGFSLAAVGELRYSKVFLFDVDGDGVLEVVTDVGFVRGDSLAGFPRSFDAYRFQCDFNTLCLLLLDRDIGLARIHAPGRFLGELSVDGPISVSNHPYSILAIGSKAYWRGLLFKASLDPVGLRAFLYEGRLALAYIDRVSGYVVVEVPGYLPPDRVLPFNGSIVGVGVLGESILLLLSSPTGSALLEWSPRGVFKVTLYNVVLEGAIAYADGAFIANGEKGVYLIRQDSIALLLEGYKALKAGLGGEVVVLGLGKALVAEAHSSGLRALRESTIGDVVDVDYGDGVLVYTDGLKVNSIKYTLEDPVELSIPPNAIAGEPVTIAISGSFNVAYVNLPGIGFVKLTPDNPGYTWVPSTPGSFNVVAIVDVGGYQHVISKPITVAPRPAILTIVPESLTVKPYSSIKVTLEVRDGITRESLRGVLGECILNVPGNSYPVRPWIPVTVPTVPLGVEVPITAQCTLPQPYGESRASITLRLSESYVRVEPLYLGGGLLRLYAYNMYTGEPLDGEFRITIGGNTTTIRVGGEVRIPRPGVWEVRWELLSGNVVLHSGSTTIHYYERVEEAPQHVAMVVADRFITITTTDIATKTELLTMTTEVPRVDPVIALLSFIAGIALAGTPLVVLLIRRGGGAE